MKQRGWRSAETSLIINLLPQFLRVLDKPRPMRIRRTFRGFDQDRDVSLIFSSPGSTVVRGKYLVGFHNVESGHLIVVFDPSASFHRDIALEHRLRPRGGGWLEMDTRRKKVTLYGRSQAYGREPDRELVRSIFMRAFPDFTCTCER
jgi:hypothetical protein